MVSYFNSNATHTINKRLVDQLIMKRSKDLVKFPLFSTESLTDLRRVGPVSHRTRRQTIVGGVDVDPQHMQIAAAASSTS